MSEMELDMEETLREMRERDPAGEPEVKSEVETEVEPEIVADVEPEVSLETEIEPETTEIPETEPETPQIDPEIVNAPSSWTAEAKSKYAELPEWAKREVHKRETDMSNGAKQQNQRAAFGDRINQIVSPYMPIIRQEGGTPESVVETMLNVAYTLRQGSLPEKLGLIQNVARQYGFYDQLVANFAQGVDQQQQGQQNNQAFYDPRVDELERRFQAQQSAQQAQTEQEAIQAVQGFIAATNEDGSLKHPYFDNVKDHMAALYESGLYDDLEAAYDAAVWANPETKQLLLAQQAKEEADRVQAEAKERSRKAREADKLNTRESGSHTPRQSEKPTGSVEDTMREIMASKRANA